MYKLLLSEKGFTLVELIVVVTVLAILTAVAVPVAGSVIKTQRIKDCKNQAQLISTAVQQAMYGMIDNGKRQPKLYIAQAQADHRTTYSADSVIGNADDEYDGDVCFVLIYDQQIPGKIAFTLGDLRGGYRDVNNVPDYNDGCLNGNYLKKAKLKDTPFHNYLSNNEIPVCPFADYDNTDKTDDYYYYIFEDGSVICSCPECH